jgi:hypothetical protein
MSYGLDDWRARCAIKAFDRWIVGDDTTGKLASVDPTYRKEYNDPLIWHLESGDNASFPARIKVPRADFDFTAGVGNAAGEDPIETDPVVMISWSLNGGRNFGNEVRRSLGKQGEGDQLVTVNRLGMTKAKGILKIDARSIGCGVSDPVPSLVCRFSIRLDRNSMGSQAGEAQLDAYFSSGNPDVATGF